MPPASARSVPRLAVVVGVVLTGLGLAIPSAASAAWLLPARISGAPVPSGQDATNGTVVIDGSRRATAAWQEWDGTRYIVRAAKYAAGVWTAPVTVSSAGSYAQNPVLGLGGTGNVTLVWSEGALRTTVPFAMMAATSSAGVNTWTTSTVDASATQADAPAPTLVIQQSNGAATLFYERRYPNIADPYPTAIRRTSGTWRSPVQLAAVANSAVTGAITGNDKIVAMWRSGTSIDAAILVDTTGDGAYMDLDAIAAGSGARGPLTVAGGPEAVVATWGDGTDLKTARWSYTNANLAWMAGDPAVISASTNTGRAVSLADYSNTYVYAEGNVVKAANRALNGTLGSATSLSTDGAAVTGFVPWMGPSASGYPMAAWSTASAPGGVNIASNSASGWPAPANATFVELSSAAVIAGATSRAASNPVSVVLAKGDSGPASMYAIVNDPTVSVPGAPTIGTASLSGVDAAVAFTAPSSDGGSAITSYTATCTSSNGGTTRTGTGTPSPVTVTNLSPAKNYTCTVTASNAAGASVASSPSNSLTVPMQRPSAPGIGTATVSGTTAIVPFTAPPSDGGSLISEYMAECISGDGGVPQSGTGTASPVAVPGLSKGRTYTCSVVAQNSVGTSAASGTSNGILVPTTPPGPPRDVTATALSTTAIAVTWVPPADDGGSPITGYVASIPSSTSSCSTGGDTTCTITGLSAGGSYTVVVRAVSGLTLGEESAAATVTLPTALDALRESESSRPGRFEEPVRVDLPRGPGVIRYGIITYVGRDPALGTNVRVPGVGTVRQYGDTQVLEFTDARETARSVKRLRVCSTTKQVRGAGTVAVACPLTTGARRVLARRSLGVTLTTVFIGKNGARSRSVMRVRIPRLAAAPRVTG